MEKTQSRNFIISLIIHIIVILLLPNVEVKKPEKYLAVQLTNYSAPKKAAKRFVEEKINDDYIAGPNLAKPKLVDNYERNIISTKNSDKILEKREKMKSVVEQRERSENIERKEAIVERNDYEPQIETENFIEKTSEASIEPLPIDTELAEIDTIDVDSELSNNVEGAPNKYTFKNLDKDISATWDPKNKNIKYPLEAEQRGESGVVELILSINKRGRIIGVEKISSGYKSLDFAADRVARTWKIYLSQNGQRIAGKVKVEIPFVLSK